MRKSRALHHYGEHEGLPPLDRFYVSSFGQDQRGNVWIGFSGDGGLVRYRNERFERFGSEDGIPPGGIRNLITDARGRPVYDLQPGTSVPLPGPGDPGAELLVGLDNDDRIQAKLTEAGLNN